MKPKLLIKALLLTFLVIWVGTGNASFKSKCCKAVKQTKSTLKAPATIIHFAPLDVLKW